MKGLLLKAITAALLVSAMSTVAAAPYVGLMVGESDTSGLSGEVSYGAFGGYRFGDYFAAEVSYNHWGDFGYYGLKADVTSIGASAVVLMPLADGKYDLFAKVGVGFWDVDSNFGYSFDGTDLTYGGGVAWNVNDNIGLAVEYQVLNLGSDVSSISLAFKYTF